MLTYSKHIHIYWLNELSNISYICRFNQYLLMLFIIFKCSCIWNSTFKFYKWVCSSPIWLQISRNFFHCFESVGVMTCLSAAHVLQLTQVNLTYWLVFSNILVSRHVKLHSPITAILKTSLNKIKSAFQY